MPSSQEPGHKKTPDEIRLRLQAESSLLAWMGTCLGLMGFGFVIARFGLFLSQLAAVGQVTMTRHASLALFSQFSGIFLILLSVLVLGTALYLYRRLIQSIDRGEPDIPSGWTLGMLVCVVLIGVGVVLATYLSLAEF